MRGVNFERGSLRFGQGVALLHEFATTLGLLGGALGLGFARGVAAEIQAQGVGGERELVKAVGAQIGQRHLQRVEPRHERVGNPVVEGVAGGRRGAHGPVVGGHAVELRAHDAHRREGVGRSTHLEVDLAALGALVLHEILRAVVLVEPREDYVVGVEGRGLVGDQRVGAVGAGQCVGDGDGPRVGCDERVVESHIFRAVPAVVAVKVVKGEYAVGAGLEVTDCEAAVLVGLRDAVHREGGDGGVGEVAVHSHHHALGGLEVGSLEHHARNAERVDRGTGGEVGGKAIEHVSLVKVADRVGKIHGVCHVGNHRVAKFHLHPVAVRRHRRRRELHGRYDHLRHGVGDLHVLVEIHTQAVALEVDRSHAGIGIGVARRLRVAGASLGASHAGAGPRHQGQQHRREQLEVGKSVWLHARKITTFFSKGARQKMKTDVKRLKKSPMTLDYNKK